MIAVVILAMIFVLAAVTAVVVTIVAPAVAVTVVVAIPAVAMLEVAVVAVPVASVVAAMFMARPDPVRADIRRATPIAAMPAVMSFDGIPVAFDPNEVGARADWNCVDSRRRRSSNYDSDRYLPASGWSAEQHQRPKRKGAQQNF